MAKLGGQANWADECVALEPWLRRWVRRNFPNAEVDDVVQDTFVRLISAGPRPDIRNWHHYLARIARSVVVDQARRARARPVCMPFDQCVGEHACSEPLADAKLDAKQRLDRVRQSIAELPENYQQVVVLKRIEGLPTKAVASNLGLSVRCIEKYLTDSMRTLAAARS